MEKGEGVAVGVGRGEGVTGGVATGVDGTAGAGRSTGVCRGDGDSAGVSRGEGVVEEGENRGESAPGDGLEGVPEPVKGVEDEIDEVIEEEAELSKAGKEKRKEFTRRCKLGLKTFHKLISIVHSHVYFSNR